MVRRTATLALLLGFFFGGRTAHADPSASELLAARELFREAEADEQRGNFEAALEKMKRVARVKSTPGVRVHIAYAEETIGKLVAALDDYTNAEREALEEKPEKRDELLRSIRPALERLRSVVPQLKVEMDPSHSPADLSIMVDGQVIASSLINLPMRVEPGEHKVEARATGYLTFQRTLETAAGTSHSVAIVLAKAPSAPKADPSPSPPQSETRTGALLATGGAVLFVGGGVASFLVAGSNAESERTRCAALPACEPDRSSVRVFDSLAIGGFVAGAALATVAVILWTKPAPKPTQAHVRFTPFGAQGAF